jgi:hypothetical protein
MLSHPISLSYLLILDFHLTLDLPNCFFTSGLDTKSLYAFLIPPIRTIRPTHLVSRTNHENLHMPFSSVSYHFLPLRPN